MTRDDIKAEDFESVLEHVFGDRVRADDKFASDLWCALSNVSWYHPPSKQEYSCTFRAAGGLVAQIRGSGTYMDWYLSGDDGVVSPEIALVLGEEGWTYGEIGAWDDDQG